MKSSTRSKFRNLLIRLEEKTFNIEQLFKSVKIRIYGCGSNIRSYSLILAVIQKYNH